MFNQEDKELRKVELRANKLWLEAKKLPRSENNDANIIWSVPSDEQRKIDQEERDRVKRIDIILSKN